MISSTMYYHNTYKLQTFLSKTSVYVFRLAKKQVRHVDKGFGSQSQQLTYLLPNQATTQLLSFHEIFVGNRADPESADLPNDG